MIITRSTEQNQFDYQFVAAPNEHATRPRPHRIVGGVPQILYARVSLKSQILRRDFTATPPRPVRAALENGSACYGWGKSFVYFRYDDDAQAYRDDLKQTYARRNGGAICY